MFNISESVQKIFSGEKVILTLISPTEKALAYLNSLLAHLLSRNDRIFLLDTVITVLREIILNSFKANAKRVFYEKSGLQLHDPEDYGKGMEQFREIISNIETLEDDIINSKYRITVSFVNSEEGIRIEVSNNAGISKDELERINFRVSQARECTDFASAYETAYDPSEGAGLGIILIVLLMKNAGIPSDRLLFDFSDNDVKTTFILPLELRSSEITTEIKERIIDEIDSLPTFPENIIELQALCEDSHVTISTIAEKISSDPAITADLLRLSNSAGFFTSRRITNINEAIMTIGLKNLKLLLAVGASRKIMDKRYKKFSMVWEHCNKTAFYAKQVAIETGLPRIADSAFLAGLLHDIGKIVLLSLEQPLIDRISDLIMNRGIRSSAILEEIYIGISHSEIGYLIAQKWNFPEIISGAIKHHHAPLSSLKNRDTVTVVYLANMLCNIELQRYTYGFIEIEAAGALGLKNDKDIIALHSVLKNRYSEIKETSL